MANANDWLLRIGEQTNAVAIHKTNEYTSQFGLVLSEEDTKLLLRERTDSLKEQQRVEFGEGILPKLIFTFCDSPYLYQDNYVDTISRLQDIFYLYKNESLDELTDDELLDFMKQAFDGVCQGSLDYLEETVLEQFASEVRRQSHAFIGKYEETDD